LITVSSAFSEAELVSLNTKEKHPNYYAVFFDCLTGRRDHNNDWVRGTKLASFFQGLALVCSAIIGCQSATAQTNWPSFRGSFASGIATDSETPATWNTGTGQHIGWKTPIPGLGHSSPVIWGPRLFVTTAVNEKKAAALKVGLYGEPESAEDNDVQRWEVFCLDKSSGKILWQVTSREGSPKVPRHPKATHANCTVATDGTNIVGFFGSEGLYCYDMDGHLRWQKDFGRLKVSPTVYNDAPDPKGTDLDWGFASSPVIYNGRVFVQCDTFTNGFVAAFDLADGEQVWRTSRDDSGTWSTPNICLEGPRPQLIVNGYRHMGGYDLATGAEIWRLSGGGDCPVPTPVVWNGLIFLMSAHGPRSPIYAVKTDAAGDISLKDGASTNRHMAWSIRKGGSYMQTPVIYESRLYSCHVDGILSCFDAASGKLLYKERLGSGGDGFTASPAASRDRIYFTSEQGAVYVVKPGPVFNVIATNQMGEVCMATPAISGETLFFRTQGKVVAIRNR
jgi:outer membrane protein assembly factor BamB